MFFFFFSAFFRRFVRRIGFDACETRPRSVHVSVFIVLYIVVLFCFICLFCCCSCVALTATTSSLVFLLLHFFHRLSRCFPLGRMSCLVVSVSECVLVMIFSSFVFFILFFVLFEHALLYFRWFCYFFLLLLLFLAHLIGVFVWEFVSALCTFVTHILFILLGVFRIHTVERRCCIFRCYIFIDSVWFVSLCRREKRSSLSVCLYVCVWITDICLAWAWKRSQTNGRQQKSNEKHKRNNRDEARAQSRITWDERRWRRQTAGVNLRSQFTITYQF